MGRLIELRGRMHSCKTTVALSITGATQRAGGFGIIIDNESGYDPVYARKLGVDPDRLVFIQSFKEPKNKKEMAQVLTVEGVFARIETTIKSVRGMADDKKVPVTIVWDSVAATPSQQDLDSEIGDQVYASAPKIISTQLKTLIPTIAKEKITLVFVNQMKDKIGATYGDKTRVPGGDSIPFHATLRGLCKRTGWILSTDKKTTIGSRHTVTFTKNKIAGPNREAEFQIMFDTGLDRAQALLDEAVLSGYATKSGGWHEMEGVDKKFYASEWPDILETNYGGIENYYNQWFDQAQNSSILIPYGLPSIGGGLSGLPPDVPVLEAGTTVTLETGE